ncbi:helix-turn-helix domain-containing protein [Dysgonomonas sp. ZJ709]
MSPRTLQRLRSTGVLPFKKINQKTYYLKSDVLKVIENNLDK